jgi:hypothetical protein
MQGDSKEKAPLMLVSNAEASFMLAGIKQRKELQPALPGRRPRDHRFMDQAVDYTRRFNVFSTNVSSTPTYVIPQFYCHFARLHEKEETRLSLPSAVCVSPNVLRPLLSPCPSTSTRPKTLLSSSALYNGVTLPQAACEEVRKLLAEYQYKAADGETLVLTEFEFGAIANLVPSTVEEARALVKSLERVSSNNK